MRKETTFLALCVAGSVGLAWPAEAEAFTTRVHVAIANAVRQAAIAGGGTIPLRGTSHAVALPAADFEAIRDYPLAFRAGAIGPDNMVFPGMTDPSHALGRRPFEQCQALYEAAATGEERAYALGCFLHGTTDAVAHHFVNFLTGETFTLNPITTARATSFDNVVRHIVAEGLVEEALFAADPGAFDQGSLLHGIPNGFVLRTYLDAESPVWQMAAEEPLASYEAARAQMPDAPLPQVLASMDVGPADHLLLTPVYLAEIDAAVDAARADIEARIAELQDPGTPDGATLGVGTGPDGVLGTKDDETACTVSCPTLYATYFVYTGLLAPRYDAAMNELPSAFDKVAEKLRDDLFAFHPAYVQTVGNLSARLNEPLEAGGGGFDLEPWEVEALAAPMIAWADGLATIDYDTLLAAILPDWFLEMQMLLQQVGIDVDVAGIVEAVFQPLVLPIEQAIRERFIDTARTFLEDLVQQIEVDAPGIEAEFSQRIAAATAADLPGTFFDHLPDSGLYAHAFNLAAAALAEHAVVLPAAGAGPVSFDASYAPAWMQAGVCAYLAPAIFPLGPAMAGLLSVRGGDGDFPAVLSGDSPVECHDGALNAFAADPTVAACQVVKLSDLLADPVGSISRAYPPELGDTPPECADVVVPGLPEPPAGDTGGSTGGAAGSGSVGGDGSGNGTGGGGTGGTAGDAGARGDGAGCACRAATSGRGARGAGLLMLAGLLLRRRRRSGGGRGEGARRARMAAGCAAAIALGAVAGGCHGSGGAGDGGTGASSAGDATAASGTASTGGAPGSAGTAAGGASSGTGTDTGAGTGPGDDGLLEALDGTRWYGEQVRDGVLRAYELAFDTQSMLWAEIRNPYGPARLREMRSFTRDEQGRFHTIVVSPRGWPVHPENGRMDTWEIELVDGNPRTLRVTRDGVTEVFTEGPFPAPETGMTAVVRVFAAGGTVDEAFCNSAGNGFDYKAIFDFAHGVSDEIVGEDVVAGAALLPWTDPTMNNQFSVTDLDGFDRYGGTELSDTFNFMVVYLADMNHPGGTFSARERDDAVEDAVWMFLGDKVGSDNPADLFLEVHGFIWPDGTPDEPSTTLPAGPVPIEAILVRCTEPIEDVDLEVRVGAGPWIPIDQADFTPRIDDTLFPPAL